jgi:hypothetical protein
MRVQTDEGVTTRSLSGSGAWISVQLTPSIRSQRFGDRSQDWYDLYHSES